MAARNERGSPGRPAREEPAGQSRPTPERRASAPAERQPRVRIRPATLRDLPQVTELFGALHAYNATFDKHFELTDDWPTHLAETMTRAREEPDSLWALAWDGQEAVGLLIAETHFDPPIFRRRYWLELSALYVRPSHRRHGVAKRLVDHLLDWARERGFETVQLYVSAANAGARAFYAREGFEVLQEIWRKQLPPADDAAPAPDAEAERIE